MYTYPHSLNNNNGEELTFVRRTRDEKGEYLEVTNKVKPGSGPPMHVHHYQDEGLTVTKGRIGYQVEGQEPEFAEEGETVVFTAGTPHRFWNAGDDTMECTGFIRPPDNIEYFLGEIYASIERNGGERPDTFDAAYLTKRYESEFAMTDIPAPVRTLVFPLVRLMGRLTGRHKRFAGAPEPVRR